MLIHPGERLLFIGDSITDCGRGPLGAEGSSVAGLGGGYVSLVHSALTSVYPDYKIQVINMGVSGNTIRDLKARWHSDVLRLRPTWLSIMIGINDVWQHFDPYLDAGQLVSAEEFAQSLDDLIRQTLPGLLGLVLMTPYYLETRAADPMRALMDQFGRLVRQAAQRHIALFVDTQLAFDHSLAWTASSALAPDGVHVNQVGHMILARAFLEAIGFDWSRAPKPVGVA
jgi:lysophospholipase L1-like esterase